MFVWRHICNVRKRWYRSFVSFVASFRCFFKGVAIYIVIKVKLIDDVKSLFENYAIQHLCKSVTYVENEIFLAKKCFDDLVGM